MKHTFFFLRCKPQARTDGSQIPPEEISPQPAAASGSSGGEGPKVESGDAAEDDDAWGSWGGNIAIGCAFTMRLFLFAPNLLKGSSSVETL